MLYQNVEKQTGMNSGQTLAGALISFAIAIMIVMAILPSVNTSIASAGLTGATLALADLLLLVIVVVLIYAGLRIAGLA